MHLFYHTLPCIVNTFLMHSVKAHKKFTAHNHPQCNEKRVLARTNVIFES